MMVATRDAFGEELRRLGESHSKVVVLDADLSASTKSGLFAKRFPDRFFQMGIAEANMIGTAAGLAFGGYIPFACSFACFLTGRFETIRVSIGYSDANVKLVGTHAGLGVGEDGATQMGIEDIGLLRSVPGMVVLQPSDEASAIWAVRHAVEHVGPVYLRLTRQKLPKIYSADEKFEFAKPKILKKGGKQLALLASGATVHEALGAAQALSHLDPWVIDFPVLKPFPGEILKELVGCKIVTVEDHLVTGGLGTCVAEALSEQGCSSALLRLGIQDRYGESGQASDLYQAFGISAKAIVAQINLPLHGSR